MWLWQVGVWGAFAVSWFTGLYLLLVPAPPSQLASGELPMRDSVAVSEQVANLSGGAAVFALVPVLTLIYVWEEALQLYSVGIRSYLVSPATHVDLALISIVALESWWLLAVAHGMLDQSEALSMCVQVGALGTFVVLLKGGQLMRGDTRMAFLMTMLYEIVRDMVPFLLLQAAVVLTFSFAAVLLHVDSSASADEFGTLSSAVFTSYNLLVHAAGTDNADLYFSTSTAFSIHYVFFTVLVPVVMLNALIAIMGDTYERVSEKRIERGLQQRAALLVEYERMLFFKGEHNGFGRWLHAIRRKDAAEVVGEADAWAGQLRRIKDDVKGFREEMKEEMTAQKKASDAKMDEILDLLRRGGAAPTTKDPFSA